MCSSLTDAPSNGEGSLALRESETGGSVLYVPARTFLSCKVCVCVCVCVCWKKETSKATHQSAV
jgi:hypothetical protein